ncbi:putative quinol monooxygenase [Allomuricauda sp. CAU 1633]|uniref:putative quinol monooxygenase n=1 Tax=Allomuricauda sp. CAU 1633 TaxID=2816036 RepID=UPI001F5DD807|nr:putative quinol monooxygenase [Muricauda sp. CAU 1633]
MGLFLEIKHRVLNWIIILVIPVMISSCHQKNENKEQAVHDDMMVRIAEIEIEPEFRDDYLAILKEEAEASVRLEPGVVCIYPMFQRDNPNQIRLLEIYASEEAYQSHLQTPHFVHYKTSTKHMVKSLQLVDMEALDPETMPALFLKLGQ